MFDVAAESYDRFMGRYSTPLAPTFANFAGVEAGQSVIDVGCGPGALTGDLVQRVGADAVAAIDPSESFVDAVHRRFPDVDVRHGGAESLPFNDDSFDRAVAQLVVNFMADPVQGLREMARVTRPGGIIAATVWDLTGGRSPLGPFWRAVNAMDPGEMGERSVPGGSEGDLSHLLTEAGLATVEEADLVVTVEYESFEAWWEPFTLGVGPAGGYLRRQDEERRIAITEHARDEYPDAPGIREAHAWAARGTVA
jgi:SAM-dependent methyltransferase